MLSFGMGTDRPHIRKYLRKAPDGFRIRLRDVIPIYLPLNDLDLASKRAADVSRIRRMGGRKMPDAWWRAVAPMITLTCHDDVLWNKLMLRLKNEVCPTPVLDRWMREAGLT